MRVTAVIVFIFLVTISFGQKWEKDRTFALVKKQTNNLDSLCDKIHSQVVHPRFYFFCRAKIKYYSSTHKAVQHKIKIRYTSGVRYKKEIYRYENRQKITIISIGDKEETILWKRKNKETDAYEVIKMMRLDDSTMVWSSVKMEQP